MFTSAAKHCFLSLRLWQNSTDMFTAAAKHCFLSLRLWQNFTEIFTAAAKPCLVESATVTELHWYIHCCQTLLPESATVTEHHWYVHCCDEHTTKDMHSQMEISLTLNVLRPKRWSWGQTVMNTQLRIYTRPRCSPLPPNTASWVCDCDRTSLICSLLPPNPASRVCDCDWTSLRCSLLLPNPASWVFDCDRISLICLVLWWTHN